jgi:hypothetical protein
LVKITEVVHFSPEKKASSILTVDDFQPEKRQERFVKEGGFFLRVADGEGNGQTIKLSDTEMTSLVADIDLALDSHRRDKLELFSEIESRQRSQ